MPPKEEKKKKKKKEKKKKKQEDEEEEVIPPDSGKMLWVKADLHPMRNGTVPLARVGHTACFAPKMKEGKCTAPHLPRLVA